MLKTVDLYSTVHYFSCESYKAESILVEVRGLNLAEAHNTSARRDSLGITPGGKFA